MRFNSLQGSKMNIMSRALLFCVCFIALFVGTANVHAQPDAPTKFSVIREENPNQGKETLILPYAFPSDTMGTTFGVGDIAKGHRQEQLLFGGSIFGSADDARGFVGGMWDYKLPGTERLFFSAYGAYAHFPRQREYSEIPRRSSDSKPPPAGSTDSDKDDYIEDEGDDNWLQLKLEYVLLTGSMKNNGMSEYHLKDGLDT
jgi:hypothetical protein